MMSAAFRKPILLSALILLFAGSVSCSVEEFDPLDSEGHLPLGDMPDWKADGPWGHALECKEIPEREALIDPHITISLNGLTLQLRDRATGFSKVYPVGVGEIQQDSGSMLYRNSRTMYPVLATGGNEFSIDTARVNPCTVWWRDKETGQDLPVFAGLPFMSFHGPYGIHGPITGYTQANGGSLKRGYVSHGCVRMEGADVAELWAHIKHKAKVPVRVQKAVERTSDGLAVDLDAKWILSECYEDQDCNYQGGICKKNPVSGRGFCTAACSDYCFYDKPGYPETFCIDDPDNPAVSGKGGYCTYKASAFNYSCRRFEGFDQVLAEPRFSQPWVIADVCKPIGQGWIGDRCGNDGDCRDGRICHHEMEGGPGFCTESCSLYCPDATGYAGTVCVKGQCRSRCNLESYNAECPLDFICSSEQRYGEGSTIPACMPL